MIMSTITHITRGKGVQKLQTKLIKGFIPLRRVIQDDNRVRIEVEVRTFGKWGKPIVKYTRVQKSWRCG